MLGWLDKKLSKGFYFPVICKLLSGLEKLSLTFWIKECIKNKGYRDLERDKKAPRWVSELYQVAFIVLGALCLILQTWELPIPFLTTIALWAFSYRLIEILVFILNWIFVHDSELHLYKRSIMGFSVNVFEVALYTSIVAVAGGCASATTGTWKIIAQHLAGIVTVSPPAFASTDPLCTILHGGEMVASVLLVIVVLGALVGTITRKEVGGRTKTL